MTDAPPTGPVDDSTPAVWPSAPTTAGEASSAAFAPLPAAEPAQPQQRTSTNAIVALVLSIVSWTFCPLVTSIVAIVLAYQADKEIRSSDGAVTGQGLSFAAKIIAWINIGVSVALIVLAVVFGLVLLVAGGFGSTSA
ncbi:MAG: DUF4190 domain-containing protein [Candidatus Nanopelagicales bacterium]